MFTYQEVLDAFKDCYKSKRNTQAAQEFIFGGYVPKLMALTNAINDHTYRSSPSTVFIICDPKVREVFAAAFVDRIVHHLVVRELLPLFLQYFVKDTYSCLPTRGTLAAVMAAEDYINRAEAIGRDWYVMKMDVKSFFMGIRKSLLADRLESFIRRNYRDQRKLEDLVWLVRLITLSDPTIDCIRRGDSNLIKLLPPEKSLFFLPPDKGLPIGNYSSQVFANFYMTPLDWFILFYLGIPMYCRYVDDFIMFGPKELLLESAPFIYDFARDNLDLTISEDKFYLQPVRHGVKFIGSMIMPGRVYCGNRVRGRLEEVLFKNTPTEDNIDYLVSAINSYLGLISHYSSYNIRKELLIDKLPDQWKQWIRPVYPYTKILRF